MGIQLTYEKGHKQRPTFEIYRRRLRLDLRLHRYNPRSMSIVAKRLNGSSWNLARSRPRPSPNCVKWGPSSPPPQGHSPQLSAMSVVVKRLDESRCSLLGTEVGLGPGGTMLDGDPAPPPTKGHPPPIFGACLLWPNGWTDQDATWQEGRPRPRPHCVRWGATFPSPKGHSPQFSAHVYCGQTVAISATAKHLLYVPSAVKLYTYWPILNARNLHVLVDL